MCVCLRATSLYAGHDPLQPWLSQLDRLEAEIDVITERADTDAPRLIAEERFAVRGDRGLAIELSARPGAMQSYLGDDRGEVIYQPSDEDPALSAARAWVYQVELFAACVRRGETPVIRQSPLIDTKHRRLLRYSGQTFHHDRWPDPPAPGSLARRYLAGLRTVLLDITTGSGNALDEASARVRNTLDAGGKVYVVTGSTMLAYHLPESFEPWTGQASAKDLVLAVGDFEEAGYHGHWHDLDAMRKAGGVVWILNACNTPPRSLPRGEVLLDLWAPFGDGVVTVEHYDARLGPVTGVAQLAVVHALAQQAAALDSN